MLKALLKGQLMALSVMFRGKDGKKSIGKILLWIFILLYTGGTFTMMFGEIFSMLLPETQNLNAVWLVFSLHSMLAFSFMFITSVFTTKSYIFEAKDNDLMLSMPIQPLYIIISRSFTVYLWNVFEELLITIPLIVSLIRTGVILPIAGYVAFVLILLTLPLLASALAAIIGALVSILTKNMRAKSFMTVVFFLIFFGAYMYFFPQIMGAFTNTDAESLKSVFDRFPPVYWLGSAIGDGNIIHMLLSLIVNILPFLLVTYLINLVFYRLVTDKGRVVRKEYKEKALKSSSQFSALVRREFIHLGKSPMYLLNVTFGALMDILIGVALIIFAPTIYFLIDTMLNSLPPHITGSFVALLCSAISATILLTAASISLEGKTLYLIRSMPVSAKTLFMSKLSLNAFVAQPVSLFLTVTASVVLHLDFIDTVIACITVSLFSIVTSEAGLLFDLRFPMLEWDNEAVPVKQGTSIMLTLVSGLFLIAAPVLVTIFLLKNPDIFIVNICYMAFLAIVGIILLVLIMKKGEKMLERISK